MRAEPGDGSVEHVLGAQVELLAGVPVVDRCCPLCAHPNRRTPASRYSLGPWPVKRCVRCGFVHTARMPDQRAPAEDLDWSVEFAVETPAPQARYPLAHTVGRSFGWRTGALRRRSLAERVGAIVREGAIVDVGCGDGTELARLPARLSPIGIEISAARAERARERLRGRTAQVVTASLLAGLRSLDADSCHGAILRFALEQEAEPRRFLDELGRVLVHRGIALVKVPNFASLNRIVMGRRWRGFRHPDRLNHFTPSSLRLLAAVAGFEARIAFLDALPTDDNLVATLVNTKRPQPLRDLLPDGSAPDGPLIVYSVDAADPTPVPVSAGPAGAGVRGKDSAPMQPLSGRGGVGR